MAKAQYADVIKYIHRIARTVESAHQNSARLLEQFITSRDEDAFAALVRLHGPLVWRVCCQILGNHHLAEDAFQATFLVLARKATSVRKRGSLSSWLYGTAYRVASKARASHCKRGATESDFRNVPICAGELEAARRDLGRVVDEEVLKLPAKYKSVILLTYWQGASTEEAARQLYCPVGTVKTRLIKARRILHDRLVRRGVTLSIGVVTALVATAAGRAPMPSSLAVATAHLASAWAKRDVTAIAPAILILAEEGLKMTVVNRLLIGTTALLLLSVGAGVVAFQSRLPKEAEKHATLENKNVGALVAKDQVDGPTIKYFSVATDQYGDPLPEGALARLGTTRFRHGLSTRALAFAPGGTILASAGDVGDGVCLWDAATGRLRHRLADYRYGSSVGFSPDGKVLTTVGPYGYTFLIDVATGKELRRFPSPAGARPIVAFSTDGRTVATAEPEGGLDIILWDIATGNKLRSLKGHGDRIQSLAFAHDGRILASGDQGKTVIVWGVAAGKEIRQLRGHTKTPWAMAFAPDRRVLASAEANGVIRLWDVGMGKLLQALSGAGLFPACTFSSDGKLLASGAHSGTISLWDPHTATEIRRWSANGAIQALAFSPDGKVLASAADCAIRLWDTRTGKEIIPVAGHTGGIRSLVFAADGKTLFSSGLDSKVVDWDVAAGKVRGRFFSGRLGPANDSWFPLDLSSDGALAAFVGGEAVSGSTAPLRLVNTGTGQETHALSAHQEVLLSGKFSPDGRLVASASAAGVRLWAVESGKEVRQLQGNQARIDAVAFSPDGKLLACGFGTPDMTICLWEVATGKEVRRWDSKHRGNGIMAIIFSPDGKLIASGDSLDVGVWAAETGGELARFRAFLSDGGAVFSPSGRVLALSGISVKNPDDEDAARICTIELWEVRTSQKIQSIDTPQGRVRSLVFAPNGRSLASGGNESTILIWDLTRRARDGNSAALTAKHLQELWVELAADAARAERALWTLARAPQESMPCLKAWLEPVAPADTKKVANLLADLSSDQFTKRDQAAKALQHLGETAEGAIRKALNANPSLEVHRRLERILEHDKGAKEKEVIRRVRAIEAVEHIGSLEARQLLEALVKGVPNPTVGQAAEAALARLVRRVDSGR